MRSFVFICIFLLPFCARGYERAEEVLSNCSANPAVGIQEAMKSLHCSGYLTGIVDGILMMQNASAEQKKYICPSNLISGEQTRQAVVLWLQQNRTAGSASARVVVLKALVASYPCTE